MVRQDGKKQGESEGRESEVDESERRAEGERNYERWKEAKRCG